jgi:hypothetical protein
MRQAVTQFPSQTCQMLCRDNMHVLGLCMTVQTDLILEIALPSLIADRAVQWVIDLYSTKNCLSPSLSFLQISFRQLLKISFELEAHQQEFHDPLPGLFHKGRVSFDVHARACWHCTGRHRLGTLLDLQQRN